MRIEDIDKNFKVETEIKREGLRFLNAAEPPFSIHGIVRTSDKWVRLPLDVAEKTSQGVCQLAPHLAGGRVRFITDSPYIAIKMVQPPSGLMAHFALTGHTGADLYIGEGSNSSFYRSFIPPTTMVNGKGFESVIDLNRDLFANGEKRTVTIGLPLYNGISELYIGLKEGSVIEAAKDYAVKNPIVFYGSSITQGGCASRPGTCYQAWLSRWFDADYINLGFSGNARGEDAMSDYIAGLDMSAFVFDYDHNSPTYETLLATHEKMLRKIRASHPDIPIICANRPRFTLCRDEALRRELIKSNVEKLRAEGDMNISFVPGEELMALCKDEGTVDGCHPTDLGFYSMALRFAEELEKYGFIRK